jgi:uncharacterized protein YdeI (YjbR/CyaY-like superfamily)
MTDKIKTFTCQKSKISEHAQKPKFLTPKSVEDWRNWLEKNHLKEDKVVMIKYKKHTGKPIINAAAAMREAICFGWIDTTAKRVDDERYSQVYVKRNQNGRWSINTLKYGKELLKAGKMSPFGIKMYEEGLKKKPHDYGIPKNPDMPLNLKKALDKNPKAKAFFDKLAPSTKKTYYRWILHTRMEETRLRRIHEIVKMCEKGIKTLYPAA